MPRTRSLGLEAYAKPLESDLEKLETLHGTKGL